MTHAFKKGDKAEVTEGIHKGEVIRIDGVGLYGHFWNCVLPIGETITVKREWLRPAVTLDPREPEAVAMVSPTHDGQANTSGLKEEDLRGPSMLKESFSLWNAGWKAALENIAKPAPSVHTVMEGITRWWQSDPSRRRVEVQGQGHTVLVWITTLEPGPLTAHAQFMTPESAETTHDILDHAAQVAHKFANLEYVNARNPRLRFPTGDTQL